MGAGVDKYTKRMLKAYKNGRKPQRFLSSFFKTRPKNIHNSAKVTIDIQREAEEVAVAITDMSEGYRHNEEDLYTNKEFIPPAFKESFSLNATDTILRNPGDDPFQDPQFVASAVSRMFSRSQTVESKIRRAIELQASQVLTTGKADLTDANGDTVYAIDFKPKATHFPTTSNAWDGSSATIAEDIISLAEVVNDDGLEAPTMLIMDQASFYAALSDSTFRALYDTRRVDQGVIAPMRENAMGGQFRGTVELGNYKFEMWTYNAKYKHPQTGTITSFMPNAKVIMLPGDPYFDATFGAIPQIVKPDNNIARFIPRRLQAGGVDMFFNAWTDPQRETLFGGVGTRPLLIPTAMDTYGCLDTQVTAL